MKGEYYCFINGKIIPSEQAFVHISDLGLLRSYAVFDYFRVNNGKPFMLAQHLKRFRNSAKELRLPFNYTDQNIKEIIEQLIEKTNKPTAGIRLVLTGGNSKNGMSIAEPNFFIAIEKLPDYPEELYREGVHLKTFEYQREVPTVKSTQYLNAIKHEPIKKQYNVYDILYFYKDEVLEVPRNNFFIFKDDVLVTAKENVLKGITREQILKLAASDFKVEERKLLLDELSSADEAFISGSTKKIIPVVNIDSHPIGNGCVGENTKRLMLLFDQLINQL